MTQQFGKQSEQIVCEYVKSQGFEILACNYKKFFGEIDIIAQKKNLIVFIEVKARKNSLVSMHELITYSKQKKIIKVAKTFIFEHQLTDKTFRFDAALLHQQDNKPAELTYIPHAFYDQESW